MQSGLVTDIGKSEVSLSAGSSFSQENSRSLEFLSEPFLLAIELVGLSRAQFWRQVRDSGLRIFKSSLRQRTELGMRDCWIRDPSVRVDDPVSCQRP